MNAYPPDTVAVHGIGCVFICCGCKYNTFTCSHSGLGHLAVQFSHAMGFRTVAISSSDAKRELALSLGATEYINGSQVEPAQALEKIGGAKVIMCTVPSPKAFQGLLPGLAIDGTLLLLGITLEEAHMNMGTS